METDPFQHFIEGLPEKLQTRIRGVMQEVAGDITPGNFGAVVITQETAVGLLAPDDLIPVVNKSRAEFKGTLDGLRREAGGELARKINLYAKDGKSIPDAEDALGIPVMLIAAVNPEIWETYSPGNLVMVRLLPTYQGLRIISGMLAGQAAPRRPRITGRQTAKLPAKVRRAPRPRQR